ncbi:MAG: CopG family transcriptional regulator [Gemmatimonadetes bacterium]|nr:CopG family transcriptional regulator [Gemmatimonadota bacterium]MBI2404276.1 CopG family transcriptional regulator [Gemmatimonadota bacterium]
MPTSVRLDKQAQARLERLARITGRTKSDLMREAIARLDETLNGDAAPTLYEQWHEVIGIVNLGPGDRARRAEELLRQGLGRKKRA